jgi:aldehyde dehydrogenase (NAD+)
MTAATISDTRDLLRATFRSGKTRPVAWRKQQLKQLRKLVKENEEALLGALEEDLGKPAFEGWVTEINVLYAEIDHTLQHFEDWLAPEEVPTPMIAQPATSTIHREPLGTVLVIGPWNYPVQLALLPLVPALAAGNCVLVKPSEVAAASSKLVAELIPKYLDPDAVRVIEGGVPETTEILALRWDHIFFTGSTAVGHVVMEAAAKHLTPVTLELGGKSPCIIDETAKLKVCANRILWGKMYNAGQTCVAPDYIFVHKSVEEAFFSAFEKALKSFFPSGVQASPDYGRMINTRHFDRVMSLVEGQDIALGGEHDRDELFIAPTLLRNVDPSSPIMASEIFGPLLPVLTYENVDEVIEFINDRPKPLALYVFSNRRKNQEHILGNTSSGGACVNQTIMHLGVPDLPFGGVGASGMGAYHGRSGIETFSHRKSVFKRGTLLDPPVIYPPYNGLKTVVAKTLL